MPLYLEYEDQPIDCSNTMEVVCPWCGFEYSDSIEFFEYHTSLREMKCEECEKPFKVSQEIEVSYWSEKA